MFSCYGVAIKTWKPKQDRMKTSRDKDGDTETCFVVTEWLQRRGHRNMFCCYGVAIKTWTP
jgi:hypothetical protein